MGWCGGAHAELPRSHSLAQKIKLVSGIRGQVGNVKTKDRIVEFQGRISRDDFCGNTPNDRVHHPTAPQRVGDGASLIPAVWLLNTLVAGSLSGRENTRVTLASVQHGECFD